MDEYTSDVGREGQMTSSPARSVQSIPSDVSFYDQGHQVARPLPPSRTPAGRGSSPYGQVMSTTARHGFQGPAAHPQAIGYIPTHVAVPSWQVVPGPNQMPPPTYPTYPGLGYGAHHAPVHTSMVPTPPHVVPYGMHPAHAYSQRSQGSGQHSSPTLPGAQNSDFVEGSSRSSSQ